MAKGEKDEDAIAAEGEGPAKPGKKKLVLMVAGAALLLGAAGGGYVFVFKKKAPEAEVAQVPKPVSFVEVREMIVNLANEPNQDRPKALKFKVALEVSEPKAADQIKPLLPRVEDTFQVFLRELRASEIEGSGGLYRLREELQRRVNVAVHPAKVDAVLFKDFVVQ